MKRIISVVCAFALALSLMVIPVHTQAATKSVYITVEKLTIGQGFIIEPTKVEVQEGDTFDKVFENVMGDKNIQFDKSTYGYYLSSIKGVDSGVLDIPAALSALPDCSDYLGNPMKAPSNSDNTGNADSNLDAEDYHPMSGWMYTANNIFANEAFDEYTVKDQDVFRCQFSLYAYGADIGNDMGGYAPIEVAKVANKDGLIKVVADVKADNELMNIPGMDEAYNKGLSLLAKYDATDEEVQSATKSIKNLLPEEETTTTQETTTEKKVAPQETTTEKIALDKPEIKSIKNVKTRRAKIKVKKVKNATGYTFKYSKYKSLKKATKKTTKSTWIKTKKFKKKQTCYVKVQAYAKKDGVKYYSKWSSKRKVKIKK